MVWQQERAILDHILLTFFRDKKLSHLDFACGTGRILSYLADSTEQAVGVDVSPSMLEVARKNNKNAVIIEKDITQNDVLDNRKFNLITAFRFFPNAQPELRNEVMKLLDKHLDDDGYIVFNNHRNTRSALNRLRKFKGHSGYQGMNTAEVKKLLTENRLKIIKVYHLRVFPARENKTLLPIFLLHPLDALLSKCKFLQNLGTNLIFVCRKSIK